jgi:ribosome-associated translation inhibitor RaiA
MQSPLEIHWHHVDRSDALDTKIREHVKKLESFCADIISCRVSVERPHGRHHQGNLYNLRITLKVPGKEIVVQRDPAEHHAHEDVYVSLRDAFDAVMRRLEDYTRIRRGQTKQHDNDALRKGTIVRLFPDERYGFLRTPDAREIYFAANAVSGMPFDHLREGIEVSFIEEMGSEGPQAASVLTGKHDTGL